MLNSFPNSLETPLIYALPFHFFLIAEKNKRKKKNDSINQLQGKIFSVIVTATD